MLTLSITEPSQIAQARRAATDVARRLGFTDVAVGQVALVTTELATNLTKHASQGQLLIRAVTAQGGSFIELLALDKGPGIADVARCLRDGYSTAGSPGTGLGAIMRGSSVWDIYSLPAVGTAVLAQLTAHPRHPPTSSALSLGAVCLPKPEEEECGDAWAWESQPGRDLFLVVDGLGHGPDAATAAREAVRVFAEQVAHAPETIISALHAALRWTRGAAVAVADVDRTKGVVRFCGVGNVSGTIVTPDGSRSMVSHNGIVGHHVRKMQEFQYPWAADALLVLYSDGLASRWSFDAYPGLLGHHPSLIAGVLYRDLTRNRDDVTVVVAKEYANSLHHHTT